MEWVKWEGGGAKGGDRTGGEVGGSGREREREREKTWKGKEGKRVRRKGKGRRVEERKGEERACDGMEWGGGGGRGRGLEP